MKKVKIVKEKGREFHVQGRILKWNSPPECIADRWEIIPSISLSCSKTCSKKMLTIRFAWICFELSFSVVIFRFLKMIEI